MKRIIAILGALLVTGLSVIAIAADTDAGLKVGDAPGAFNVKDITGPNAGTSLCYRCKFGARPVVSVFTREINEEVAKLIKEVDTTVGKHADEKMAAFVVVLAEDADAVAPKLEALAKEQGIQNVPLTIFDGTAGPGGYHISQDADVTVMMWNKSKVKANVALGKGELNANAISSIVADTAKLFE